MFPGGREMNSGTGLVTVKSHGEVYVTLKMTGTKTSCNIVISYEGFSITEYGNNDGEFSAGKSDATRAGGKYLDEGLEQPLINVGNQFFMHEFECFKRGPATMVGTIGGQSLINIGDSADSRIRVNLGSAQTARIAFSVIPLMMLGGNEQGLLIPDAHLFQHANTAGRMLFNDFPLLRGQGTRFIDDFQRNVTLADVVQKEAGTKPAQL